MAEEFFKNNIPFVVFDPIDVWWGLRFAKDGKKKGLPVIVFGLEHADIPLTRDMGKQIAQAIVKENVSCVISTFGMPKTGQRELMTDLAEELLKINNTPRHIFIEEAHEFVPQRVFGAMGKVFNAVSNLVVMGRNRGLGVTLINQRAATINKDVLTQLDTLLAFRNIAPQDRKALKEWVEYHAAEGDFEEFMKSLPSLPTGEGWIWSPEFMGIFKRIKIRERETFHPDRERLGEEFVMPKLEQSDIQSFIKNFKVEIETPEEGKKSPGAPALDVKVEVESSLKEVSQDYEKQLDIKSNEIEELQGKLQKISAIAGSENGQTIQTEGFKSSQVEMWVGKLGKGGGSRILQFLADKSGLKFTRSQVALAVGMSARGGSFATYISTLKRNSLILEQGGLLFINPDLNG